MGVMSLGKDSGGGKYRYVLYGWCSGECMCNIGVGLVSLCLNSIGGVLVSLGMSSMGVGVVSLCMGSMVDGVQLHVKD